MSEYRPNIDNPAPGHVGEAEDYLDKMFPELCPACPLPDDREHCCHDEAAS